MGRLCKRDDVQQLVEAIEIDFCLHFGRMMQGKGHHAGQSGAGQFEWFVSDKTDSVAGDIERVDHRLIALVRRLGGLEIARGQDDIEAL